MKGKKSEKTKVAKNACSKALRVTTESPRVAHHKHSVIFSVQTKRARIDTIRAYEVERHRIMKEMGMMQESNETE